MIVDAYKSFNRVFSPSRADIESYLKVLDRNGDGRVTIQDLEPSFEDDELRGLRNYLLKLKHFRHRMASISITVKQRLSWPI